MSMFLIEIFIASYAKVLISIILFMICRIFLLKKKIIINLKPDYFLKFFFWLDLIATISMIFDIGWINIFSNTHTSGSNASQAA